MNPLRIRIFQNIRFEGSGAIAPWAVARGHRVDTTHWYAKAPAPDVNDYDWLVIMGGPMSVTEEKEYSWLAAEKRAVADALESGKPVLGICLGAQMIADVLGAPVTRNRHKEIGWFPIRKTGGPAAGAAAIAGAEGWPGRIFPAVLTTFHWHGETFALPLGADLLAASDACDHQAFAWGNGQAVGLQFHPEATPEGIAELLRNCSDDLRPGPFVQDAARIKGEAKDFAANAEFLNELLTGMEARALRGRG